MTVKTKAFLFGAVIAFTNASLAAFGALPTGFVLVGTVCLYLGLHDYLRSAGIIDFLEG